MEVVILNNKYSLLGIGIFGILLATIYTAILASQLMATKHKVDYLYYKNKFTEK
jgi:mannose/fructose/N-acetylgalactosamine-specific phosphotransferase system component IIC